MEMDVDCWGCRDSVILLLAKGGEEIKLGRPSSIEDDDQEFGLRSWWGDDASKGKNWEITK